MEEIIAPAYKAKDGRIYISRFAHMEIVQLFKELADKEIHKESIQGFITSYDRFVDRKEALEIAKKNNKNLKKLCPSDELYSEDLFLNEQKLQEERIKANHNFDEITIKMAKLDTELQQEQKVSHHLQNRLDEADAVILLMSKDIANSDIDEDICKKYSSISKHCADGDNEAECIDCVREYYFKKVRGELIGST